MLELNPDQVHLWVTFFDDIRDEKLLARYRLLLQGEERQMEQRIPCATSRHRYLVTRALVRTVLSCYAPVAPEQWRFTQNSYGKPEISNGNAMTNNISFNVSHTEGQVVLGVMSSGEIGVDTEEVRDRRSPLDAAEAFFSSEESDALGLLPSSTKQLRLLQYWTLKESYIKARGMGLSIPLNQFSFHFLRNDRVRLSIGPQLKDEPSRWHFWQLWTSEKHMTAVCAERLGNCCMQLELKQVVPLGTAQSLNCVPILESE
ncbi:MAG: 4'-phosphopantetheinyl transferase superfamily protein [Rhodocyclaceae bacterium]|nr:MAG: 4'-phosphopantetheinyl transferase superfamily protein [Rhodocyclaceae bacterium]